MKKVVDRRFAKSKEYAAVLEEIESKGHCPFCPENFKYSKKPIIKKQNGWFLTENSWPYENSRKHLLIISAKHKEKLSELSGKDFATMTNLAKWAIKKEKIAGGALTLRFGDTSHTGASVCHLHFHLITPELGPDKKAKTVNFPIG